MLLRMRRYKLYDTLLKQRKQRVKELRRLLTNPSIRGSIRVQGNRCGNPTCRCKDKKNPVYHGPYPYLSFRGIKSNHSILLNQTKEKHVKPAIENYKKIMALIIELSEIDFALVRYHYKRLGENQK